MMVDDLCLRSSSYESTVQNSASTSTVTKRGLERKEFSWQSRRRAIRGGVTNLLFQSLSLSATQLLNIQTDTRDLFRFLFLSAQQRRKQVVGFDRVQLAMVIWHSSKFHCYLVPIIKAIRTRRTKTRKADRESKKRE